MPFFNNEKNKNNAHAYQPKQCSFSGEARGSSEVTTVTKAVPVQEARGVALGGTPPFPPNLQHGPPVFLSMARCHSPQSCLPSALRETPSICCSPSGSIIHPSPSAVSQNAAKGLLSSMSNQPKFVPRPQFDKLSSEAAIWEGFCHSSSFQKQLGSQGSPA